MVSYWNRRSRHLEWHVLEEVGYRWAQRVRSLSGLGGKSERITLQFLPSFPPGLIRPEVDDLSVVDSLELALSRLAQSDAKLAEMSATWAGEHRRSSSVLCR